MQNPLPGLASPHLLRPQKGSAAFSATDAHTCAVSQMQLSDPPFRLTADYITTSDGLVSRQSMVAFQGLPTAFGEEMIGCEASIKGLVARAGCAFQAFTASMRVGGSPSRLITLSYPLAFHHTRCIRMLAHTIRFCTQPELRPPQAEDK